MAHAIDRTGIRYGRLVVLRRDGSVSSGGRNAVWLCQCDCGGTKSIASSVLQSGRAKSCGCLQRQLASERKTTHGLTDTRAFKAWGNARLRCYSPKNKRYAQYGGRGIQMCERWRNDAKAFVEDMGECPPGMTLERIDTNGNYEFGNCEWASRKAQSRNRRTKIPVEYGGRVMALSEFCEIVGVGYSAIKSRIYRKQQDPVTAAEAILGTKLADATQIT